MKYFEFIFLNNCVNVFFFRPISSDEEPTNEKPTKAEEHPKGANDGDKVTKSLR